MITREPRFSTQVAEAIGLPKELRYLGNELLDALISDIQLVLILRI